MGVLLHVGNSLYKFLQTRRYTIKIKSAKICRPKLLLLFLLILTIMFLYEFQFVSYLALKSLGFESCSSGNILSVSDDEIIISQKNIKTIFYKRRKICPKFALPIYKNNETMMHRNFNYSDCSLHYVTVNPKGGLGNKICQYLSLAILKDYFGIRVAIYHKMYDKLSSLFKVTIPVSNTSCFTKDLAKISYYTLYSMLYKEAVNNRLPQDALKVSYHIEDYPCPAEVLIQNRKHIREMLSMHNHTQEKVRNYIKESFGKFENYPNKILISVHVRRNDYFKHMNYLYQRSVLSPCYYINAMNFYRKRYNKEVTFLLSSDDLAWCQAYLSFPDVIIAGNGVEEEAFLDFSLMSFCQHHIVGLGTFGFLSAYFGNGTIMYPLIDTDRPSELERSYICSDSYALIPMLDSSPQS